MYGCVCVCVFMKTSCWSHSLGVYVTMLENTLKDSVDSEDVNLVEKVV